MKSALATVIVFVLAVGIAIAAVPRTDLVRAMDHAKRYIDGLLDGIGPVAERASECRSQMAGSLTLL